MMLGQEHAFMQRYDGVPRIVWVVVLATLFSCIAGEYSFAGYQASAVGWLVPLIFCGNVLIRSYARISMPSWVWIPWIILLMGYLVVADAPNALQRTVMMCTPFVVGLAASTVRMSETAMTSINRIIDAFAVAVCVMVIVKTGIYATGALPEITGLAAEAMTAVFLCTIFAARYVRGDRRALVWWLLMAAIPVVALTRTAMLLGLMSLPLSFAPMHLLRRLVIVFAMAAVGLGLFYTERVQNKMFWSGQGDITDVRKDNPDFRTTGRTTILDAMEAEIERSPWYGNGANASERFVSELTDGMTHPHNDWLRLIFDYGYFGAGVFGACVLLQVIDIFRRMRGLQERALTLSYACASSFLIYVGFMFTDNIILYAAFFGNLQFTLLGLIYGMRASTMDDLWWHANPRSGEYR